MPKAAAKAPAKEELAARADAKAEAAEEVRLDPESGKVPMSRTSFGAFVRQ